MDGTVILWDPDTGKQIRVLRDACRGFPSPRVQFSPDGRLLCQGTQDGGVKLWHAASGDTYKTIPGLHKGLVRCVAFGQAGLWLASGGADGKVVISELASGKLLYSSQFKTSVCAVAFHPERPRCVVASFDHPEPLLRECDFATGKVTSYVGHANHVVNFSVRPDGRLLASCSHDGSVRLWEMTVEPRHHYVLGLGCFGQSVRSVAFSPEGRYLATGNGNGTVYLFRLPVPEDNLGAWMEAQGGPPLPGLSHAAWVQRVKGLSPGNQLQAVAERLRGLNPGFDGKLDYTVENGQVVSLDFGIDQVKDITPLQALPGLRKLDCRGSWFRNGKLADLTPLKGMKLTELSCCNSQVADLSLLQGMPLRELRLGASGVTDLSLLKGLPLTVLDCGYTPISDLSPLKDMKLRNLYCWHNAVNDAGLIPLQGMTSLRLLEICGARMTDAGFVHLHGLTELETLRCGRMKLTGAGLVHLKGMTRLQVLGLFDTEVTDEALVPLKDLHTLRVLELHHTRLTDAGLQHLTGLKNLVHLDASATAVTDKGIAKLKAALPGCQIAR
jgi:hypothetical protein